MITAGETRFIPSWSKYSSKSGHDIGVRRWIVKNKIFPSCGWVQRSVSTSLVWFIDGIGSLLWWCFRSPFCKYRKSKKWRPKTFHHNFFHRHAQTSKSSSLERGHNSKRGTAFTLFVDAVQKYLLRSDIWFSYVLYDEKFLWNWGLIYFQPIYIYTKNDQSWIRVHVVK